MTSLSKLQVSQSAEHLLEQSLDEAFPAMDPGVAPLGSLVIVQIKTAARRTKGGIHLVENTVETEHDNTQTARVVAVGPLAFCNRETGKQWVEGAWVQPGDFVRVPKYGTDQWRRPLKDGGSVVFAMLEDLQIKGKITIDPLSIRAFI